MNKQITLAGQSYTLVEPPHKKLRAWRKNYGSLLIEPMLAAVKTLGTSETRITALDINQFLDMAAPLISQAVQGVMELFEIELDMFFLFCPQLEKDAATLDDVITTSELMVLLTHVMEIAYPLALVPVLGPLLNRFSTAKN